MLSEHREGQISTLLRCNCYHTRPVSVYQISGGIIAICSSRGCYRFLGAAERNMMMALLSVNWAGSLIYGSQNSDLGDLFVMFLKPKCHKTETKDSPFDSKLGLNFMHLKMSRKTNYHWIQKFYSLTRPLVKILFKQDFRLSLSY